MYLPRNLFSPLAWSPIILMFVALFNANIDAQDRNVTGVSVLSSDDVLGPGDLLEVNVAYCPELTHSFRVGANDTLVLPLLHNSINVSDATPQLLARRIEASLVSDGVLVEPVVSVSVLELQSRPVSVVGAVNRPLTFQANSHTTLVDAIARAGGLTPTAGGTIILTSNDSTGLKHVTELPVVDLFSGSITATNISLHGGEEIRVPEIPKIFVTGNVRHPGMYPMQNNSDTTVVKALALSSGLDQYSASMAYIYRKIPGTLNRKEIEVPLKSIMKRHSPDVALAADDILYVPSNDGRRLAGKVIGQIAGFGQTAEAGLFVAR